jgi:anti-anti-sigma factor
MDLHYKELEGGIRLVTLSGKLDIHGVADVEKVMAAHAAGERVSLLVDLSQVGYMASIGIRLLLMTAKALKNRGGRMLIVGAVPLVEEVLVLSGISQIIHLHVNIESALTSLADPV